MTVNRGVDPLPEYDGRNEILIFHDGSKMEVNEQMRRDNRDLYLRACRAAVSRSIREEGDEA